MTIRPKFRTIEEERGRGSAFPAPENTEGWMQMGKTMGEKAFREHVSWVMFLLSILVIQSPGAPRYSREYRRESINASAFVVLSYSSFGPG